MTLKPPNTVGAPLGTVAAVLPASRRRDGAAMRGGRRRRYPLVALPPANALSLGPDVLYFFTHTGRGGGDSTSHPRAKLPHRLPSALGAVKAVAFEAVLAAGRLFVGALSHALTIA